MLLARLDECWRDTKKDAGSNPEREKLFYEIHNSNIKLTILEIKPFKVAYNMRIEKTNKRIGNKIITTTNEQEILEEHLKKTSNRLNISKGYNIERIKGTLRGLCVEDHSYMLYLLGVGFFSTKVQTKCQFCSENNSQEHVSKYCIEFGKERNKLKKELKNWIPRETKDIHKLITNNHYDIMNLNNSLRKKTLNKIKKFQRTETNQEGRE